MMVADDTKPSATENQTNPQTQMIQSTELDDDPLLIAQTLTYVTDDGSVVLSFQTAPFSFGT
jgi:hypothetical protein